MKGSVSEGDNSAQLTIFQGRPHFFTLIKMDRTPVEVYVYGHYIKLILCNVWGTVEVILF